MAKRLVSASDVRLKILESLYEGWKARPGPDHYFPLTQVWSEVYAKLAHGVDNPLSEGVWNGLQREGLIQIQVGKDAPNVQVVRISDSGRKYLEQHRDHVRTRRIAIFGVITGLAGVFISIVALVLQLRADIRDSKSSHASSPVSAPSTTTSLNLSSTSTQKKTEPQRKPVHTKP